MSSELRFVQGYGKALIRLAEADLNTAALLRDKNAAHACFYARQTVDSCLRAVLIACHEPVPTLPDLRVLVLRLPPNLPGCPHADDFPFFELYSATAAARERLTATAEEAVVAFNRAQAVLAWASSIVALAERSEVVEREQDI